MRFPHVTGALTIGPDDIAVCRAIGCVGYFAYLRPYSLVNWSSETIIAPEDS